MNIEGNFYTIYKKDGIFHLAKMTEYGLELAEGDSSKVFADDDEIWTEWEELSSEELIDRLGLE